jgi:phosphopantetheine adenylyltransferase
VNRCNSSEQCSLVSGYCKHEVDAIVSEDEPESLGGAQKINQLRVKNGLKPLHIILKKSIRTVSSTQIREWIHEAELKKKKEKKN